MKIRKGFVSNSSSSSFYIGVPDNNLSLGEIASYYGIDRSNASEELKAWLTFCIWYALNKEPSYASRDAFDWLSDENLAWEKENYPWAKSDDYYNGCKSMIENHEKIVTFEVGNGGVSFDSLTLPWEISYELDNHSEELLTNTARGFGVNEH